MTKLTIEEVIDRMNMKAFEEFSIALNHGSTQKQKPITRASYFEEDWIKAIRKKKWSKIEKMYNCTGWGLIMRIINKVKEGLNDEGRG